MKKRSRCGGTTRHTHLVGLGDKNEEGTASRTPTSSSDQGRGDPGTIWETEKMQLIRCGGIAALQKETHPKSRLM